MTTRVGVREDEVLDERDKAILQTIAWFPCHAVLDAMISALYTESRHEDMQEGDPDTRALYRRFGTKQNEAMRIIREAQQKLLDLNAHP